PNSVFFVNGDKFKNGINKETAYDVFSFDGKFLFSTKINGHIYPQLIFKNGYVYSLIKDESGFSRAIRLRMKEN
ncbi:unnamed protein product, partial [marine sediment metagenome]